MTTQRCPHCGRELGRRGLARHIKTCPLRPEIADAMRAAMTGADGYAKPIDAYEAQRGAELPTIPTVMAACGSWVQALAHFGIPQREGGKRPCPHCGREYRGYGLTNHVNKCPCRPEIADALRDALTSEDDGYLVSYPEYDAIRTEDLPHPDVLVRTFGGWANLAVHFGLIMRPPEMTRQRRSDGHRRSHDLGLRSAGVSCQDDPLLVGAVRVRVDYGEGDGLAYYGVRQMEGRTVYMLR